MTIPPEATAILRRMKRRGYDEQTVSVCPAKAAIVTAIGWWPIPRSRDSTEYRQYKGRGATILTACRDIERQWKREQKGKSDD